MWWLSLGFLLIVLGGREKILVAVSPSTPAWHLAVVYFGGFWDILYQKSFGIPALCHILKTESKIKSLSSNKYAAEL